MPRTRKSVREENGAGHDAAGEGAKKDPVTAASANRKDGSTKKSRAAGKGRAKARKGQLLSDQDARAALEASDKLYYRIGEVSQLTGVKAHVLRYWESEFRWMAPPKSRAKQRLYRKRDIEFVWLLKNLLWDERYTIAGARQRIQDLGVDEAMRIALDPDAKASLASTDEAGPAAKPESSRVTDSEGASSWRTDSVDTTALQAMLGELRGDLESLRADLAQGL